MRFFLHLREIFHSYGRFDDSNEKLDEITKLLMLSYFYAINGQRFSLQQIRIVDNIKLNPDEYYIHWQEGKLKNRVDDDKSVVEKITQIISDIKEVYNLGRKNNIKEEKQ